MTRRTTGRAISATLAAAVAGAATSTISAAQTTTEADTFSHTVTINRQAEDVWAGLVTKSVIDAYYFAPISADLTGEGQSFFYGTASQTLIAGEVLAFRPPLELKHSFRFSGRDQPDSVVTYALSADGGATDLTVTHSGYRADSQTYADIAGGWPIILDGLKAELEKE